MEFDGSHKTVDSLITKRIAGLVKRSEHAVLRGICDANDIQQQTSYIEPSAWDERTSQVKTKDAAIMKDEAAAKQIRGRMVMEDEESLDHPDLEINTSVPELEAHQITQGSTSGFGFNVED
jgi:hypothetical protein